MPPPRELFTIGGEQFNILNVLRDNTIISVQVDKLQHGDDAAMDLIRRFQNIGVTPKEYHIAMPRLLEYAAKEEVGFDADFIDVTQFLMSYTLDRTPGDIKALGSSDTRIAYFANVYGRLEMIQALIWKEIHRWRLKRTK